MDITIPTGTHFHIRWHFGKESQLDWERFGSREEADADARARAFAHLGEDFSVEECGASCPRCRELRQSATAR